LSEHAECIGDIRNAYNVLIGKGLNGRDNFEELGIDRKVTLKWILGNKLRACGRDTSGSGKGQVAGSCEHDNETSRSVTYEELLD